MRNMETVVELLQTVESKSVGAKKQVVQATIWGYTSGRTWYKTEVILQDETVDLDVLMKVVTGQWGEDGYLTGALSCLNNILSDWQC
jgi:hypothetical protein